MQLPVRVSPPIVEQQQGSQLIYSNLASIFLWEIETYTILHVIRKGKCLPSRGGRVDAIALATGPYHVACFPIPRSPGILALGFRVLARCRELPRVASLPPGHAGSSRTETAARLQVSAFDISTRRRTRLSSVNLHPPSQGDWIRPREKFADPRTGVLLPSRSRELRGWWWSFCWWVAVVVILG